MHQVRPEHVLAPEVYVERTHPHARAGLDEHAGREAEARGIAGELRDDEETQQVADAARCDQVADDRLRIAAQLLEQRRKQHHGRELQHAHGEGEEEPEHEVAIREGGRREQRSPCKPAMDQEEIEACRCQHGLDHNLQRVEPVVALAAVEKELRRADGDRDHDETGGVETPRGAAFPMVDGQQDRDAGREAQRQDQEEGPAPVQQLADNAAEGRPEDRSEHAADAPHHDDERLLLPAEAAEQDRLAEREDRRSEGALNDAERDQGLQRCGETAQHGGAGETEHRAEQKVALAEFPRKPAGQRRGDGRRDEVEGEDPGNLVLGRRQRPFHLRQNDGDAGERDAEEQGDGLHRHDDQPLPTADAGRPGGAHKRWLSRASPANASAARTSRLEAR